MSTSKKDYQCIINTYLKQHNIKVRSYFRTPHGKAYLRAREIKIPKPVDELTFYICLHEIGHIVALNEISIKSPNWLHEFKATNFGLTEAKKHKVKFPAEVEEAILGYYRYQIKRSLRVNTIENISEAAFDLAKFDKAFWMKQIKSKRIPVFNRDHIEEHSFLEWRKVTISWSDQVRSVTRLKK